MSRTWNRTETWLALVALAIGLVILAVMGVWVYVSAMTRPLHPDQGAAPAVAHEEPAPRWADAAEQGRRLARAGLAGRNLPGLSVAVGVGGEIVWAEGFGWADLDERRPVTPDTRFRIGTASIPLTSAAAGLLLEDGRLDFEREIQTYVPAFPRQAWPVTLRQLMGHTAGVRNDGGDEGPLFSARCDRATDALPSFAERPLLFEPGTVFRHSSYGWILVSAAVEAAADEPFLRFMRKRIFEPLGMDDTRADIVTDSAPNRATPYFPRFAADPRHGQHRMREIDLSCYAGASVFQSTPSDLVRFGLAMAGGTLLQPATVTQLQTSQRLRSGHETLYGLGWSVETTTLAGAATRLVGHDGDLLGGQVASLLVYPDSGIVVAVTSNVSYADTRSVAARVASAFADH